MPRFERLVPLLTLILGGLGIVFLLDVSPTGTVFNLGSDLPVIPVAWPLVLLLSLLAGAGVEFIIRAHPRFQRRMLTHLSVGGRVLELLLPMWIMPAMTPAAVFAFFRLFRGELGSIAYLGILVGTGFLLLGIYIEQHRHRKPASAPRPARIHRTGAARNGRPVSRGSGAQSPAFFCYRVTRQHLIGRTIVKGE
ncbi:MAG: hypothetical protein NVS4B8_26800 [Herpetosiphon sp.]